MKEYVREWSFSPPKKSIRRNEIALKNIKDKYYCKIQDCIGERVILDRKFRFSPPDMDSELSCASAIVLHSPHRNAGDLLSGFETFVEYYQRYINSCENCTPSNDDRGSYPTYPNFKENETDEIKLFTTQ